MFSPDGTLISECGVIDGEVVAVEVVGLECFHIDGRLVFLVCLSTLYIQKADGHRIRNERRDRSAYCSYEGETETGKVSIKH